MSKPHVEKGWAVRPKETAMFYYDTETMSVKVLRNENEALGVASRMNEELTEGDKDKWVAVPVEVREVGDE